MSNSSERPWSNSPNAPQITYSLYLAEKESTVGIFICSMLYGIVAVLFFRCMSALLNPIDRAKGAIKWGLVAHTVAMFSFVTITTAVNLNFQSISYVDDREFPGDGALFPGPLGYQFFINSESIATVSYIFVFLNGWLADGLLLYRCYIIYAINYWVIAFPCLMFLASLAMGIAIIYYQASQSYTSIQNAVIPDFGSPYYAISFALNVILTSMIVIRLILHSRNIRKAMGPTSNASGLYKAIVTVLVESAALYAVVYLLFLGTWASQSPAQFIFNPILAEIQVIAPFLITLRVADRRALTSETIVSGNVGSIQFRSQGDTTVGSETLPVEHPVGSTSAHGETSQGLSSSAETVVEGVQL